MMIGQIEARSQIENLINGSLPSLDELFQMRARLRDADMPRPSETHHFPNKKTGTGPLTVYQPTTPRR